MTFGLMVIKQMLKVRAVEEREEEESKREERKEEVRRERVVAKYIRRRTRR